MRGLLKKLTGGMTLSKGLRNGFQFCMVYKNDKEPVVIVYCYKGATRIGSNSVPVKDVLEQIDAGLKSKIDVDKMKGGGKYFFLPKDKEIFTLQLRNSEGEVESNEIIAISLVEVYEK